MKKIAISINLAWPLKRYHELVAGIQEYNNEFTNWTLVWDHFPENYLRESLDKPYYDGVIGRIKYDCYEEAQRLNIPVVNTWQSSTLDELPSVFPDFQTAGKLAAEHLLKRGFRNFVSIDHDGKASDKFYKGFAEAIKPYNSPIKQYRFHHDIEQTSESWGKFHKDFAKWVKEWQYPVGIGCSVSSIGPQITTRLSELGIDVPSQASLLTVGNDYAYCEGLSPKISSINIDFKKQGYECAKMMHLLLEGKELPERNILIPPSNLVARESTDAYAVEDDVLKIALRYIADNFEKNIQVIDVASCVNVSRRALEKRFQKYLGHTIVNEIERHKVTALKRYLLETDFKINALHKKLGFSSPHHLRRSFKRSTGVTPGEYRTQNNLSKL